MGGVRMLMGGVMGGVKYVMHTKGKERPKLLKVHVHVHVANVFTQFSLTFSSPFPWSVLELLPW